MVALALPALAATARAADPFAENVRTTPPRTPAEQQRGFKVPPGFELQLFAAEPDIGKPINMAFDERGRLWVSESREYPFAAPLGKPGRDAIKILEDTDGDGRADRITVFADGLNIPMGVLPYRGGAIAFSIPNIWHLRDTDGDGRADQREILYGPLGWEADTHGMNNAFRRGLDGWIYLNHGFNNRSTYRGRDGSLLKVHSGNILRVRADGSRVEAHSWGQVNPFGSAFDPLGNLYTADCHSAPVYQVLRGAHYPSFGKPDDGLGFGPALMEHSHGSTAIAGLVYYADDVWPAEFRDNVFIGNVMTSRVHRDRLVFEGTTPKAIEQADLITTDDPWFRPVDLQLGPDGALYVADFYNRIIGHYEVPLDHPGRDRERGRIWRLVYRGTKRKPIAPVTAALVRELASASLPRRTLATHALVDRGGPEVTRAARAAVRSPDGRVAAHAAWVLARAGVMDEPTLGRLARHRAELARVHAARVLAEAPSWTLLHRPIAHALLRDRSASVRRAAADALARHPAREDVAPLLASLRAANAMDTHLVHGLRLALRDELAVPGALDQLRAQPLAEADARAVADVAVAIPSRAAGTYLAAHLDAHDESSKNVVRYVRHAARYVEGPTLEALGNLARERFGEDPDVQLAVISAMQEGTAQRGEPLPESVTRWGRELLAKALADPLPAKARNERVITGARAAAALEAKPLAPRLRALLAGGGLSLEARGALARALRTIAPSEAATTLVPLIEDDLVPAKTRTELEHLLAAAPTGGAWRTALDRVVRPASYSTQVRVAQALAGSPEGTETLLAFVQSGTISPRALLDRGVKARLAGKAQLKQRVDRLTTGVTPASQDVEELIVDRRATFKPATARVAEGAKVFQKACVACHAIEGKGGVIGPQLDGAGSRGLDRLLEDVLDPNRNVDHAFRGQYVTLKNDEVLFGLPRREEGEVLVMAELTGRERAVPRREIKARRDADASLMPDNFGEALSEAELHDLMAFLLAKTGREASVREPARKEKSR